MSGPGQFVSLRSLSESIFKDLGIQVPGGGVAIEKDWLGS